MAKQLELDHTFLEMAYVFANLSKAKRRKVGCIIVKDGQVISNGFNGTPSGFNNRCEVNDVTKPEVLHAESNALMKIARSTNSSIGSTMYLTCSPCFECAKLIIQSGITRLVYKEDYRKEDGIDLLRLTDIIIEKI
jgi:dCMP deaminase